MRLLLFHISSSFDMEQASSGCLSTRSSLCNRERKHHLSHQCGLHFQGQMILTWCPPKDWESKHQAQWYCCQQWCSCFKFQNGTWPWITSSSKSIITRIINRKKSADQSKSLFILLKSSETSITLNIVQQCFVQQCFVQQCFVQQCFVQLCFVQQCFCPAMLCPAMLCQRMQK